MYQTQQNYGYQQPYQTGRSVYSSGLKGRPVTSFEEARASMIDFDGSVFYFPDLANRKIYTKQINVDGTALINVYELKVMPVQEQTPMIDMGNYITREEFDKTITQLREGVLKDSQVQVQPISEPAPTQPLKLNF